MNKDKIRSIVDTLNEIKEICYSSYTENGNCKDCLFFDSFNSCIFNDVPSNWNNKECFKKTTITHDEYIILKNFSEEMKEYYIARDSEPNGNILNLYIKKPQKKADVGHR